MILLQRLGLNRIPWTAELAGILLVYFVQGAIGLARLATTFYFKDNLGLSPSQTAALTGIAVIPWTVKPLYGWLSDHLPLAGYRRRPYLLLSGVLGCLAWLVLALWANSVWLATAMVTLGSLSVAIGDVIVDSLVVERSRSQDWAGTGSLQSLSWGATALGSLVTAYLGGLLLQHYSPQMVFGLTAGLPLLTVLAVGLIQEAPVQESAPFALRSQIQQIVGALRQPAIGLPILFVFFWQATPNAESAFFYFVTNDLGFGAEFLGQIRLVSSLALLLGVAIFQLYLRWIPLRPLFAWITLISAGLGLTSLILVYHLNRAWGIDDHWFSLGDTLILTVAGQIAYMPILVLAARLCPAGIEATLFALLMSILNLAGFLSHEWGAGLMQWLGISEHDFSHLGDLVVITNLVRLLPLLLLGWLPAQLPNSASPSPGDPSGASLGAEALDWREGDLSLARATEAAQESVGIL
ncbi:MAG: folate/biopterin family MFS transporter [Cyanobacteriota bacterium]|nr:folate/biopterin family MFS transporter [Cyanobacteriota bacterium]